MGGNVTESVSLSISQSVRQSVSQSVRQSVSESGVQSTINCKHGYSEESTAAEHRHGFSLLQNKWQIKTVYVVLEMTKQ